MKQQLVFTAGKMWFNSLSFSLNQVWFSGLSIVGTACESLIILNYRVARHFLRKNVSHV